MLTFPPPDNEELDTIPSHDIHFQSWNKIYQRRHLFRLARTCKYLKSVVYPILFENWACHEKLSLGNVKGPDDDKMHGINLGRDPEACDCMCVDCFTTWYFISKPSDHKYKHPELWNSKARSNSFEYDPKFYLVAGYRDIPESAIKYVRHLGLLFNGNNVLHSLHLPSILPKLTSLNQVTFHMDANLESYRSPLGQDFALDFYAVIHLLLKYKGSGLRVNFYLKVSLFYELAYTAFFNRFKNEWKAWTSLNIHTLAVDISSPYRIPPKPFDVPGDTLKSLKQFFRVNEVFGYPETGEMFNVASDPEGIYSRGLLKIKWLC